MPDTTLLVHTSGIWYISCASNKHHAVDNTLFLANQMYTQIVALDELGLGLKRPGGGMSAAAAAYYGGGWGYRAAGSAGAGPVGFGGSPPSPIPMIRSMIPSTPMVGDCSDSRGCGWVGRLFGFLR